MRIAIGSFVAIGILLTSTLANAQALQNSPIIFHSGQWDVHRTRDAMTDATVCTGVYRDQYSVQLSENMLVIALSDGVKEVQLRFDDADALPPRKGSPSEFKNGRIEITGSDFTQVLDSKRLRYEAQTVTNGTMSGDINLDGVFQVHGNVAAGCSGNPIAVAKAATDGCTTAMRDRMMQKGIAARDIDDICSAR